MLTSSRKDFSFVFGCLVLFLFVANIHAQTEPRVAVGVPMRGPHPSWEGRAAGDPQSFVRSADDFRSAVLTQSMPNVWLEFRESEREKQPTSKPIDFNDPDTLPLSGATEKPVDPKELSIRLMLPSEATELLKVVWDQSLLFDYGELYDKAKTPQEGIDRDRALIIACENAIQKLQKIEITAMGTTRAMSDKEAESLVYYVRRASANLVKSIKTN